MENILKPTEKVLVARITACEKEYEYLEKVLYSQCVADVRANWKSEAVNDPFIKGPVRTFLVNWGMMGRVLGMVQFKEWEVNLVFALKKYFDKLKAFQNKSLEKEDIERWEKDIKEIYQEIREIVGPTSASKILHLICPNFFPLWDSSIRKRVGANDKEKGYYKFMVETKDFLGRYSDVLGKLAIKYDNKSKLRLVDEYLWWTVHRA